MPAALFYKEEKNMNIILSKNIYPLNRAHRMQSDPITITGEPRSADTLDILEPEIVVEYNPKVLTRNFAFIPQFLRYYTFEKPPTIQGKKMILHLEVDVFYTYRAAIMASQCIAERSSSRFDLYLNAEAGYEYYSYSLPYTFNPDNGKYILAVAGGV